MKFQLLPKGVYPIKANFKKFYLLYVFIFSYLVLRFFPYSFVPDYLGLGKVDVYDYFYLLTEITASIFGILITVILLTFQMLKVSSLRRREENILHNKSVQNFVSLSVFIIIGSVYSYSSIHNFENSNNITIAYFLLFLFFYFIVRIYPVAVVILDEVNWLNKAVIEIRRLQQQDYQDILPLQFERFQQKESQLLLFQLISKLTSAIRDNDNNAVSVILHELNKKTIELIGNGTDRNQTSDLCQALTFVWTNGNAEALRSQNLTYYSYVWESLEELHENAAEKKIPLLHVQDLDGFVFEFIEFLYANRISATLTVGAKALLNTFQINLRDNCPPQSQISDLYYMFERKKISNLSRDSDMQWDYIIRFFRHIQRIHTYSIKNSNKELFISTQRVLIQILVAIEYGSFAQLESYQEAYIVIDLVEALLLNAREAMEHGLFEDTVETYKIEGYIIAGFVNKGKFFAQRILQSISDFMILNQRERRLSHWLTLNMWGVIPRHTSKNYSSSKLVRKSTEFVLSTLVAMKQEIEIDQLPDQSKNYLEIKNQIRALKLSLIDDGNKKIRLISKIDKILETFQDTKAKVDFRIVKWK